jgi:hypothetical protein
MDYNKMVQVYVKIRDRRSELKKAFEAEDNALKAKQELLENTMMGGLDTMGVESIRTEHGTVYKSETMIPSAADWAAVYAYIREHDAFEMLEKRLTRKAVKEFMEAHDGGLPPGVQVFRKYEVNVRRS